MGMVFCGGRKRPSGVVFDLITVGKGGESRTA